MTKQSELKEEFKYDIMVGYVIGLGLTVLFVSWFGLKGVLISCIPPIFMILNHYFKVVRK